MKHRMNSKIDKKSCKINKLKFAANTERNKDRVEGMVYSELGTESAIKDQNVCLQSNCYHLSGSNSPNQNVNDEKLVYFAIAREWKLVGPGAFWEMKKDI